MSSIKKIIAISHGDGGYATKRLIDNSMLPKIMRDPPHVGVATVLNEIASITSLSIKIDKSSPPIQKQTRAICYLFGFDPLYLTCKNQMIFIVDPLDCLATLKLIGDGSVVIDKINNDHGVYLRTITGRERPLQILESTQLPQIC
jgi:hydrogenase expression/formation protein HypE